MIMAVDLILLLGSFLGASEDKEVYLL